MTDFQPSIQTKLHFQRFEFKYVVADTVAARIKQRILPYLAVDPFAAELPGQSYEVVSLYYDSPELYYYHQKMDGVSKRKKVRLRTYRNGGQLMPYTFFEIKRKHDAVVLKDRFVVGERDYDRLILQNDFSGTAAIRDPHRKSIIQEFEWEQHLRSIEPKLLVVYHREPYHSKFNKNIRITFDHHIRAMPSDTLLEERGDMTDILPGQTVLEIKFTGTLPFYIHSVISEFDLSREAYSKYCEGVNACAGMVPFQTPFPGVERVMGGLRGRGEEDGFFF